MKHLIISILLALGGLKAFSHDQSLAAFTIYQVKGVWVLKIDFVSAVAHEALAEACEDELVGLSEKAYQETLMTYLKNHIELRFQDGTLVEIGEGGVRVGHRVSQAIFPLRNFHGYWPLLSCSLPCFSQDYRQANLLSIRLDNDQTYKALLGYENQFQATFAQGEPLVMAYAP